MAEEVTNPTALPDDALTRLKGKLLAEQTIGNGAAMIAVDDVGALLRAIEPKLGAALPDEDARRLAEIRQSVADWEKNHGSNRWATPQESERAFFLRLLDARPSGEFVTRAVYKAVVDNCNALNRIRNDLVEERCRLAAALTASEARNAELQQSEARMREALAPFAAEFERHRERYLERGERAIMEGNFDRMPDRWRIEGFFVTMGQCRAACNALRPAAAAEGEK